ncbi:MAG: nucleoside triphosphate pyrophosphohydrolase [Pseudomonadota bacterium]
MSKRTSRPRTEFEEAGKAFAQLLEIMEALRTPKTGCPWDLEQSFATIAPYTIEEAYEVADAIQREDMEDLRDELGDLLFQVAFHSQIAGEAGAFTARHVVEAIATKMTRRHPHVFIEPDDRDAEGQTVAWEDMKASERALRGKNGSVLDDVALALPALMRAEKLQKRASRAGFDWKDPVPVFEKLDEELCEVRSAMAEQDKDAIEDEIGDVLFVCANLARQLQIDPEIALRRANGKFERRFRAMEALAHARGQEFDRLDLQAQEALWQAVKSDEV